MYKHFIYIVLLFLTSCGQRYSAHPSVVELVDMDYRFSSQQLMNFCQKNDIEKENLFEWQNHWCIYTDEQHVDHLATQLGTEFPLLKINVYKKPFYNFNREKLTGEKPASEWTHILMTANLVGDTTMQNQYLEYHRTQFEKWPEVSKGFIHADFQQVLVFRNGRQLMLVISIPKGKTLDELNPKTTENNPRVDEWNKIMAKYQQGIDDASKGATWVVFKQVNP